LNKINKMGNFGHKTIIKEDTVITYTVGCAGGGLDVAKHSVKARVVHKNNCSLV
jgi:hypothetical protein